MRILIQILLILAVIGLAFTSAVLILEADAKPYEPTPDQYLRKYARQYGSSVSELRRISKCESSGNQSAVGDNGLAIGLFQFHKSTWEMFSNKLGEKLDINSYQDQSKLAAWAFSKDLKNHWTCYTRYY